MRVVYIAHPISGSVDKNIERIKTIMRAINLTYHDVFPYAHYVVECQIMNDDHPDERKRGFKNNYEVFRRGFVDELWLYGNSISLGMEDEIRWAIKHRIPITPKTEETKNAYKRFLNKLAEG